MCVMSDFFRRPSRSAGNVPGLNRRLKAVGGSRTVLPGRGGSWGINDYLVALWRRWPIVVLAGLLGFLIGYLVAPSADSHVKRTGALGPWPGSVPCPGRHARPSARKHFDIRFRDRAGMEVVSVGHTVRHVASARYYPDSGLGASYAPTRQDEAHMAVYRHGKRTSTAQAVSTLSAISGLRDKAAFVHALVLPKPTNSRVDTSRPSQDSGMGWLKHDADVETAMNRIDHGIGPRLPLVWDWFWSPPTSSSRLLSWQDYPTTFADFFLVVPLLAVLSVPMLAKARRAEPDPWIGRLFTFALLAMMSMGVVHIFLSALFVSRR